MIHLETIGPENWRMGLHVSASQKFFVADDMRLLARAYAYREHRSCALLIYADAVAVGMALYHDCEALNAYDFSQIFIDERYQGQGYGTAAAAQILARMKNDGRFDKVVLCYIEGNDAARNMYLKLGFYHTGDRDENEIIMEKKLR
ncbi:MAG: GNAT family N-acetyltransferase [Lachnospiraceae bacterium]|nr:GNAT family N-acetyltransferase [Lachnospiraceae bacterium]